MLQILVNTLRLTGENPSYSDTVFYVNAKVSEGASKRVQEAMYESAGQQYFTLEKEKQQSEEESEDQYSMAGPSYFTLQRDTPPSELQTEDRYEAIPQLRGAMKVSLPKQNVPPRSDTAANIYDDVVAVRNTVPYQSPPNGEKEIYSSLKHKIYVHLDRKNVLIDKQIGVG